MDTCGNYIFLNIKAKVNSPTITASKDTTVCYGTEINLSCDIINGISPYTILWKPASKLDSSDIFKPKYIFADTTTQFIVTVTDSMGCIDSDTLIVFVSPPLIITCNDTTVCPNDPIQLKAFINGGIEPYKYEWSPIDLFEDAFVADPVALFQNNSMIYIKCVDNNNCISIDSMYVSLFPKINLPINSKHYVCRDSSIQLYYKATGGSGEFLYKWVPSVGLDNSNLFNPKFQMANVGQYYYTLVVTDSNGCVVSKEITVEVIDQPQLSANLTELDFGQLSSCVSSKIDSIEITNPGPTDATIQLSALPAGFSIIQALPLTIKAGESKWLRFRFTPSHADESKGTVQLIGTPCNLNFTFNIIGYKDKLLYKLDKSVINYSEMLLCNAAINDTTIVITNESSFPMTIDFSSIALNAPFELVSPKSQVTVEPNEAQEITIRYSPAISGTFSEEMRLPYVSGDCEDTIYINLSGRVIDTKLETVQNIDCGLLSACENYMDTTIVIRNTGTATLSIESIEPQSVFTLLSPNLPLEIAPGAEQTIEIRIQPKNQGAFTELLEIHAEPCGIALPIGVSGELHGFQIKTSDEIDFGDIVYCREKSKAIADTLYCSGSEGNLTDFIISGDFTTDLTKGASIAANSEMPYSITFTPNAASADGLRESALTLFFEPCGIVKEIKLFANKTNVKIEKADDLDYGTIALGGNLTKELIFVNTGTAAVTEEPLPGIEPPCMLMEKTLLQS